MKFDIKSLFKRAESKNFTTADHDVFLDCRAGYRYIGDQNVSVYDSIAFNTNFVFACTKKIEQYISSIPPHLYFWSTNPDALITRHKLISKSLKNKVDQDTRIIKKSNKQMVEIEESPLIDLLQYPAENMSYPDWIGIISSYLLITGNALLEIVKEGNTIKYLNPLKWEWVNCDIVNGKITNYRYNDPTSRSTTFTPEQVVHIRNYAPGYFILGMGNLIACIDSAQLYTYYDRYQLTLANNYAMPGTHVNVKNKIGSEDEANKIAHKFMQKFSGANNGKPLVTFGDLSLEPLSMTPKDMEYREGRRMAIKNICAVFGVPEDLVNTEDSNRASSITAINHFKQVTIFPLLSKIFDQLNCQITKKYYDEESFIWFDTTEQLDNDPVQQAQLLKTYIDSNIMTVDEARTIIGLGPKQEQGAN